MKDLMRRYQAIYTLIVLTTIVLTSQAQTVDFQIEGQLTTPENESFYYDQITFDVRLTTSTDTVEINDVVSCSSDSTVYVLCLSVAESFLNEMPDVQVLPILNKDPLNGVSTLDLVMTMRHILGITPFEEGYQLLAADMNDDYKITAFDLVQSRNLILQITNDIEAPVWKFIEKDVYESMLPQTGIIPQLSGASFMFQPGVLTYAMIDFVVVKTGDVNLTYTTN